jgi:hypothetical protein
MSQEFFSPNHEQPSKECTMTTAGEGRAKNKVQSPQTPSVEENTGVSWQFKFVMAVLFLGILALVVRAVLGL